MAEGDETATLRDPKGAVGPGHNSGTEEPVWAPSGRDWHLRTLLRGDT